MQPATLVFLRVLAWVWARLAPVSLTLALISLAQLEMLAYRATGVARSTALAPADWSASTEQVLAPLFVTTAR